MKLEGRVALVTGASRGIGAAAVRKLASEGAAVAFSYLNSEQDAEGLAEDLRSAGAQALAVRADIRDREEVRSFVGRAVETFGQLDIVVNNAHRDYQGTPFEESTWEEYQREIDQLIKGPYEVVQSALPALKDGGGAIINVGSTMASHPIPNNSFYVTAKSGLVGMTKALAVELGEYNIRANMVTPGPVETAHNERLPDAVMQRLADSTPLLGRIATCEEVADAIVLLALPEARFVSGANVLASGGYAML